MGTTANRGYTYPDSTSNVQIWTHMQGLADDVDADVEDVATDADNRKVLVDQLTADGSGITGTSLSTVLTVTLPAAGTYAFDALLLAANTVSAGRPGFGIGGTSTPTAWRWASQTTVYQQASGSQGLSASGTTYPSTGTATSQNDWPVSTGYSAIGIKGQVTVSAAGTLTMRLSEALGSGTVTPKNGSIVTVRMVN